MLTDAQQRNAAKKFAAEWHGRGYEKGETHAFWMELLQTVCGVVNPAQFITFESQVQLGHTSFIDAYIPETKVMIEQKSLDDFEAAGFARHKVGTSFTQDATSRRIFTVRHDKKSNALWADGHVSKIDPAKTNYQNIKYFAAD